MNRFVIICLSPTNLFVCWQSHYESPNYHIRNWVITFFKYKSYAISYVSDFQLSPCPAMLTTKMVPLSRSLAQRPWLSLKPTNMSATRYLSEDKVPDPSQYSNLKPTDNTSSDPGNTTSPSGKKVKLLHVDGVFSNVAVRSLFTTKYSLMETVAKKSGPSFSFLSLKSLISTPLPHMAYGLGGLIPFAAAPIYMSCTGLYHPDIAYYQLVYGATIVSFLGGVSWGESLSQSNGATLQSLCYSITLPLLAWVSVLAHPNPLSSLILISSVGFAGYMDTQNPSYPQWFKNLRFLLSSIVLLCLTTSLVFKYSKNSSSDKEKKIS